MNIKKKLAFFLAEYKLQMDQIKSIYARLERKLAAFESEDISKEMVESTGYWLHNLYCAFEDLFKMVAGFWENDVYPDVALEFTRIDGICCHTSTKLDN